MSTPKLIPADILKTLLDDLMVEESITRVDLIRGHIAAMEAEVRTLRNAGVTLTETLEVARSLLHRIYVTEAGEYGMYLADKEFDMGDWVSRRDALLWPSLSRSGSQT